MLNNGWTVAFGPGDTPRSIDLPHAWGQDVDVRWEGPAIYRRRVLVPPETPWLRFHGVSYEAVVYVDGEHAGTHQGVWDAFAVSLERFAGREVELEVRVTKNGGPTFPVRDVASGFLPYVFHTFGGIYKPVDWTDACGAKALNVDPHAPSPRSRIHADGNRLILDGRAWYAKGVLTWGWYPQFGHTAPDAETIDREIAHVKALGFNLVKFCLWLPPHRYIERMAEEGLLAWIELPLWDPSSDGDKLEAMTAEMERIAWQYRHHDNVVLWTCGCELSEATPAEFRHDLVGRIRRIVGGLVKDNSGGAEMYGGDPLEFGDFDDFHPYCDLPFYPPVLDSLILGPRLPRPILLGEFNDYDTHRDYERIHSESPYWASSDPAMNDAGVRWQHDLPGLIAEGRFPTGARAEALTARSIEKSNFIRKLVQEAVRARGDIAGYVVTGWADTPISTSGYVDEWGAPKLGIDTPWNAGDVLFLIPKRRPPWTHGGNRPGWQDDFNHFVGVRALWHIGVHTEQGGRGRLEWEFTSDGHGLASGVSDAAEVPPMGSVQVGSIADWPQESWIGRNCMLRVKWGEATNAWPVSFYPRGDGTWSFSPEGDPIRHLAGGPDCRAGSLDDLRDWRGGPAVWFLRGKGVRPAPFWRECVQEFSGLAQAWHERLGWHGWLAVCPDHVIDLAQFDLPWPFEVLMWRVDTRTAREDAYAVLAHAEGGPILVTTLRPHGGLGIQPFDVKRHPTGAWLLDAMRLSVTGS